MYALNAHSNAVRFNCYNVHVRMRMKRTPILKMFRNKYLYKVPYSLIRYRCSLLWRALSVLLLLFLLVFSFTFVVLIIDRASCCLVGITVFVMLASNFLGQLHILWHECHAFSVNRTQVRVLEQTNDKCL